MKKIMPVFAFTALAFSAPLLAQTTATTTTTLSDGTMVETPVVVTPAPVYVTPEPAVILSPATTVIAQAPMPAYAATTVYLRQSDPVLVGNTRGQIKLGGPKYDSQGRKIYSPREIGRP